MEIEESHNEELIVRYLLGDLPDDEMIRLEDRAFSDRQYMQDILAVEGDLIDDYLRGSLSERRQRQFESRFLASHERRQKVEFARALAKVASKSAATESVQQTITNLSPISWWDSFIDFLRNANPAVKLSLAAASLILVIGVPWLIAQTIKMRGEIEQLQAERQAQQERQETLVQRSEELAGQLQREREQREKSEELARQLEEEREKLAQSQKEQLQTGSEPTFASLILLPGVSRDAGVRPKLVLPQSARQARIQIGLEREDLYQSFRVEIRTAQGQEIWTQDNLRPRQSRAGRIVNLAVPENVLNQGGYELTLKGVNDRGEIEDVGYYYFTVQKK